MLFSRIKKPVSHLFLASLVLALASRLAAQTFTTLHHFFDAEGRGDAALVLSGTSLYGIANGGGIVSGGEEFTVDVSTAAFASEHVFPHAPPPSYTNSDGAVPVARLLVSNNVVYGTCSSGGAGRGTVFSVNGDGNGFTTLHKFSANYNTSDGASPAGGLVLSLGALYGTTQYGGGQENGTVFRLDAGGSGFTTLHEFTAAGGASYTNSDGVSPQGELVISGNTLFGTAFQGGASGRGTIFSLNTNGGIINILYNFPNVTNGMNPSAGLILAGNTLYGTCSAGGVYGNGNVFAAQVGGASLVSLHDFTATSAFTNIDGAVPRCSLLLSNGILYGTTSRGGFYGNGTVFSVSINGTGFTTLHQFTATQGVYPDPSTNSDGAGPISGLAQAGNALYGTTSAGGNLGDGTVFSIALGPVAAPPPQLNVAHSGTNVILTWPTNSTGFTLESTTNLQTTWITNTPGPVILNGQNTVTNPASGMQKFYRLIK